MEKGKDLTIEKNYVKRFHTIILEYEKIKLKKHEKYKYVKNYFEDLGVSRQNFNKYYNRFIQSNRKLESLKPQKRGPKYKARRIDIEVEDKIVELRKLGLNKYEIHQIIDNNKKLKTPSLTTIYNYSVKHNLNVINNKMKEEKVRYVRKKAGQLAHVDCHDLGRQIVNGDPKKYYLVSIIDDCTRIAWVEVVEDIQSLTVMFSVLRSMNMIRAQYGIEFSEMLSDNGPEFRGSVDEAKKRKHAFERMLLEMGVKHRYTRPYRPQTNGKIERFWKTLHYDLIDGTDFDSLDELKDELLQYVYYYNTLRPHQGIGGNSPADYFRKQNVSSN